MKLIKPYYEILNEKDILRASKEIELAARTCYKSEDKISETSHLELIKKLIDLGHEAMLEFGPSIVVKFVCDRGVSHELVRHRLCDFAQESTRYCNYTKGEHITFIIPCWMDLKEGIEKGEDAYLMGEKGLFLVSLLRAEEEYNTLIKGYGWQPQQARAVLPNSLKTEIVVKANIREWRHIFRLRTSKKAHPQMRELMVPLLEHFTSFSSELFNDIIVEK